MLYLISACKLFLCISVPLLRIKETLLSVLNNSVTGDNVKSPSIVVKVFPVILILPTSTFDPSIKERSTPFRTDIEPIPLKSIVLASILVDPVSKSTKKLSPTLNVPSASVDV